MRVVPCFALVAATAAGCADNLGTCQMDLAKQVVYASDGTPYYAGQGLVQAGCAEGVCHSTFAANANRKGVPYGLNFDLSPLTPLSQEANMSALRDGVAHVRDNAGEIYSEIVAGTMPPGAAGERPAPAWKLNNGMPAALTGVSTDTGKATVRNWLACGAPIVSGVTGPMGEHPAARLLGDPVPALEIQSDGGFKSVYDVVFSSCGISCHKPGGIDVGLDLSSAMAAYNALIEKAPNQTGSQAACGFSQLKLVTPGKCQESLVYLKVRPAPPCGVQMPTTGQPLPESAVKMLCDWIDAGAMM